MTTAKTHATLRKEWPAQLREDGCRMEIICPHGVGHPSQQLSRGWEEWMGVHGCDGCCSLAVFALAELSHLSKVNRKMEEK